MTDYSLKIEEVALSIGVSTQTINIWYKWARENPNNDIAKLLPQYKQVGARQTRYWNRADLWKFIEFRNNIPRGRNGIMGMITSRKKKEKNND